MKRVEYQRELNDLKVAYSSTKYLVENPLSLFYNNEVLKNYCYSYLNRIEFLESKLISNIEEEFSGEV